MTSSVVHALLALPLLAVETFTSTRVGVFLGFFCYVFFPCDIVMDYLSGPLKLASSH